jgi:hypothetical protein
MNKITIEELKNLSVLFKIPLPKLQAFREVESGMLGFDPKTGKIIIQFEPHWFKRKAPKAEADIWSTNKVEGQVNEWLAFNNAFYKDKTAAMESTSWGSMQVMGFNFKRLGFKSVGEMVDFAKVSEYNQVWLGLKYIETDKRLYDALIDGNFHTVAYLYNGQNYEKYGYHLKLAKAYEKYLKLTPEVNVVEEVKEEKTCEKLVEVCCSCGQIIPNKK